MQTSQAPGGLDESASPKDGFSVDYEMSDALIAEAVREDCIAVAREHAGIKELLIVLASAGVFVVARARGSHWLWWLAGVPPLIFALLGVAWLVAFLRLPKAAAARLAHLPNRHVRVEASEERLAFQTASERLDVAWLELKALRRRPNFWLVCLKSGTRIPVPARLLGKEAVAFFEDKLATSPNRGRDA